MDQKLKFPDYENGLANLAQSVLKNFGIREKGQKTLACVDTFLEKEYENIVVFFWMEWEAGSWRKIWRRPDFLGAT